MQVNPYMNRYRSSSTHTEWSIEVICVLLKLWLIGLVFQHIRTHWPDLALNEVILCSGRRFFGLPRMQWDSFHFHSAFCVWWVDWLYKSTVLIVYCLFYEWLALKLGSCSIPSLARNKKGMFFKATLRAKQRNSLQAKFRYRNAVCLYYWLF